MTDQEMKVQEKKEVQQRGETTKTEKVFVPAVDIYETETNVTVVAEMPGVGQNDVDIDLEEDVLTIRGNMQEEAAHGRILLQEYESGHFLRRFTVSESIDQENIKATLNNGLLTITLPKMAPAEPRKIEIKVS